MTKDERKEGFYIGILVALQVVVVSHGESVIANDIVNSVDWPEIKKFGLAQGGIDAVTVRKIEKYRKSTQ